MPGAFSRYNHCMPKGLLLYNPAAGRVPVRPFVRGVLRTLRAAGWETDVAETLNGRHATQAARQAALEHYDAVFAVGGDGTVGQVAAGLIHTETALAVLPAGTSNVWARELGLRSFGWWSRGALKQNARLLVRAPLCRVDVGLCNEQPFILWAGIGLDALTVHKLEPRPRFVKYVSTPQYFAATVWNATFWHGMDLRVWADGQRVEGHYLLAITTNIRHYAGGMAVLSPAARMDDGQMDMWLMRGQNLADAFRHFFDLLRGRHLTSEQARCLPFHTARIESETAFSIQVDGEPMLGGTRAEIRIEKQALRVLMPPQGMNLLASPQPPGRVQEST